ncbi:hypothetical protein OROGR_031499 [Orobanche gracilis]
MASNVDSVDSKLWPELVIKEFIDIMVEEVNGGNMLNGVFNNKVWTTMTTKLNIKTNRSYNKEQLKAKMNRLRALFRAFSALLQHTGFGWDSETNTVSASDEVWKSYIRVHKLAGQFRRKGLDHYNLMAIIFNKNSATGVLHHSSTQDPPNTDEENELENQYLNNGVHVNLDKDVNLDNSAMDIFIIVISIMDIDGDSSDSSDDEMTELIMINMVYDYNQKFLHKEKVRNSELNGNGFLTEVLTGSGTTCFEMFRMKKPCFLKFCNASRENNYLSDSRDVIACAIDGTHISAWAPANKQMSCRGRKTTITQNVMCVCDFNMIFTYVYSGWEGSAHDAKVFQDALTNPNAGFPWPPIGSFYLVDSGYPCTGGFLPPFRGERYHVQEYRGQGRQPTTREELFNYRHSSLRMTIERCFGVLKNRFPILRLMPSYKPCRQRLIITACCAVRNYIRKWILHDELFRLWEDMDPAEFESMNEGSTNAGTSSNDDNLARLSDEGAAEMALQRNQIADWMWVEYNV